MSEEKAWERIERRLPHYDRGKPKIRAFLTPAARAIDELDELFAKLRDIWFIETAQGQALDHLAQRWGLERYRDESDERLRARLRREIRSCLSHGTVEDLKALLELWLGWDAKAIRIYTGYSPTQKQTYPAYVEVQVPISWLGKPEIINFRFSEDPDESTFNSAYGFNRGTFRLPVEPFLEYPVDAAAILERLTPAGVRFEFAPYGGFRFSMVANESTYDSDYGFNKGKLVGVLARR